MENARGSPQPLSLSTCIVYNSDVSLSDISPLSGALSRHYLKVQPPWQLRGFEFQGKLPARGRFARDMDGLTF